MQTGAFNDDKKVGIWKRYQPNGLLHDEGAYIDDKKAGEWRTYAAKCKLVRTTGHKLR